MFIVRYKGKKLVPSKSAMRELMKLGLRMADCKIVLEEGKDAPRKRSKGCEEKWLHIGKKIINVVIIESYNYFHEEEIYLIKHIGMFTK
jgi:hypothetical protein